jgi:uracil-DNA glycosylase family 4
MSTTIGPSAQFKLHHLARNHIEPCNLCDISKLCKHKVIYRMFTPAPTQTIDILLIGEAPGQVEYAEKEPFIGPAGMTLQDIINEAIPPIFSYCIINSVMCTPFEDEYRYNIRMPSLSEVKECSAHLTRIAKTLKPKYVILLGKIAEKAFKYINCPLPIPLAVKHPSAIMQSKTTYEYDNAVLKIKEYLSAES